MTMAYFRGVPGRAYIFLLGLFVHMRTPRLYYSLLLSPSRGMIPPHLINGNYNIY